MKTGPGISSPRSGWNLLEELSLGCMRKQPRAAPWVARPSPVPAPHRRPGFCPRGHVSGSEDTWLRSRGPCVVCVCVACPVRCPRRARQRGASEATRGERAPHAPGTGRPLSEPSCAPVSLPEFGEPRGSAPWVLRLLQPGRVPLTSLGDCPPLLSTASPEAGLVLRGG